VAREIALYLAASWSATASSLIRGVAGISSE
jgi:hypothetical protein